MNEVRTMMHVISHKNIIPVAPIAKFQSIAMRIVKYQSIAILCNTIRTTPAHLLNIVVLSDSVIFHFLCSI